ncbi:MreB/Mrl family cell shape determining protein [Heliobacterium gestii]|uniref:Cell shape-determining protein MreB n=1 Tax=Heliomicrobium gestii TaxID=2699 RepID=A0A845LCQ8_HELGE|nr:rod shape-determining protein [Heliomicrobium gestii]MBM7866576.1 rod shape-determining protein MreB [Heliomicrobium gestii]MZP43144.1 MreB/Mrl family cell shape determining protein [Heliomicrobium gestii]
MFGLNVDIGIDLGTASVLVFVKGKGIVLMEPSVVAINKDTGSIIAVGEEARRMLGRTPGNIVAIRPLRDGVIADYDVTERMLRYFITKACGKSFFFKPRVMVCIPSGVTGVEERAVRQAALQAGARQAYLIEEPLAAALGAGLEISEASGSMVVDIGGGTTDIAVLSLGGIVCSKSLRVGGDKFDESIVRYIRKEHSLMIGERTAEELKIRIGTAYPSGRKGEEFAEIRGRDLVTGLPKTIRVSAMETFRAMQENIEAVVSGVKEVLERTPPELAADIMNKGIVMTGGGSLLSGLDTLIAKETKLPVHVAEEAISCVALGTGLALGMLNYLQKNTILSKKVM